MMSGMAAEIGELRDGGRAVEAWSRAVAALDAGLGVEPEHPEWDLWYAHFVGAEADRHPGEDRAGLLLLEAARAACARRGRLAPEDLARQREQCLEFVERGRLAW
jgi:hypothetical protein